MNLIVSCFFLDFDSELLPLYNNLLLLIICRVLVYYEVSMRIARASLVVQGIWDTRKASRKRQVLRIRASQRFYRIQVSQRDHTHTVSESAVGRHDEEFVPMPAFIAAFGSQFVMPDGCVKWSKIKDILSEHVYFNSSLVGVFNGRRHPSFRF